MPQDPRKRERKALKRQRQQKDTTKARHQRQANALKAMWSAVSAIILEGHVHDQSIIRR